MELIWYLCVPSFCYLAYKLVLTVYAVTTSFNSISCFSNYFSPLNRGRCRNMVLELKIAIIGIF